MRAQLTVMTWNLYLGADVAPVMAAPPEDVPAAWGTLWRQVQATDFGSRVRLMARQIVENDPAVLFLQEAYRWTVVRHNEDSLGAPTNAVVHDFVDDLIGELAALGQTWFLATQAQGVHVQLPVDDGFDVLMEDSVAVLLRAGSPALRGWSRPRRGGFSTTLEIQLNGEPYNIARGWASVDVDWAGTAVRLLSTHLEYFGDGIKPAQVAELLSDPLHDSLTAIVGGDFNAKPDDPVAESLRQAGFRDAWIDAGTGEGVSSSHDADLRNEESTLYERIDWILHRGDISTETVAMVGNLPEDRTPLGLWPSDHAAVVATLNLT